MSDLIDSNVVIEAAVSHYRMSICPGFRLEIACIRPVQMLEEHGARFIWAGGATAVAQ